MFRYPFKPTQSITFIKDRFSSSSLMVSITSFPIYDLKLRTTLTPSFVTFIGIVCNEFPIHREVLKLFCNNHFEFFNKFRQFHSILDEFLHIILTPHLQDSNFTITCYNIMLFFFFLKIPTALNHLASCISIIIVILSIFLKWVE